MKTLIVVPARYGSTRFPGKPLAMIAGRAMIDRVAMRARRAADQLPNTDYVVATDDARIVDHCDRAGVNTVMTPTTIASGSDRALAAADAQGETPEIIVNLQGDAPFTPIAYIVDVVKALLDDQSVEVATPCLRLNWTALDHLRQAKQTTPFSGTTCLIGPSGRALWFSKSILPAIRGEDKLRAADHLSPIYRHVGIYGYRLEALRRFAALPSSRYEQLEGLEQLRLLENGISIKCVEVEDAPIATSGVDAPDDLERLEKLIAARGDPDAVFFDD